ncbi:MAG: hypothetical protein ACD_67C00022G0001 [uncultured bacterium]|nr:MAG: hypothetical protein ACD_67C00022G0001 [uncultured bacterium]
MILFFVSLATFYVLFPAVWVKPERLLNGTLFSQAFESTWPIFVGLLVMLLFDVIALKGKISDFSLNFLANHKQKILKSLVAFFLFCVAFVFANVFTGMKWYDFEAIISSPKSAYSTGGYDGLFFANFFPLIFTITPLAFLSLLFAMFWNLFKKNIESRISSTVFSLTLFIFLYYLATTVNKVAAMNRYQIMIFPLAIILGGIGFGLIYENILRKKYPQMKNLMFFVIFVLSVGSVYFSRPFYISYDSPLLPDKYYTDLKDMGTGSYQAAQFINSLPDAEKLHVWTDKKGVCPFLKAKCYSGFTYPRLREANIDYAIVSAGRKARTQKMITPATIKKDLIRFDTLYDRNDSDVVYKLEINGRPRNFIKVIKLDQEFFDLYKNL